jgi:hypothetical protein
LPADRMQPGHADCSPSLSPDVPRILRSLGLSSASQLRTTNYTLKWLAYRARMISPRDGSRNCRKGRSDPDNSEHRGRDRIRVRRPEQCCVSMIIVGDSHHTRNCVIDVRTGSQNHIRAWRCDHWGASSSFCCDRPFSNVLPRSRNFSISHEKILVT